MYLPPLRARVDRRVFALLRVDPEPMDHVLPDGVAPRTVDGAAIGGVCYLRLSGVRPRPLPAALGRTVESASERVSVVDETGDEPRPATYVFRRFTTSRLAASLGPRTFGKHVRAPFDLKETGTQWRCRVDADEPLEVRTADASALDAGSAFADLGAASEFFRAEELGYSPRPAEDRALGSRLTLDEWSVEPKTLETLRAPYFGEHRFPPGAVEADSALAFEETGCTLRQAGGMALQ